MENRRSHLWIWIVAIAVMFVVSYLNEEALDESVFSHFRDPVVTFDTTIEIIK